MPDLPPVIAILDDEENMRIALRRLLSARGYDVVLFSRGTDLLEACSDGCISAVILDLHMPVMNGFDVLKKMKRTPDKPPVIVITGHDQVGNEDTVLQLGALAYLTKPIDKKPLLDLLFTVASPPPR